MRDRCAVFYHIWAPEGGRVAATLLVDEQLKRVQKSGLHNACRFYCCITGPEHNYISKIVEEYPWVEILEKTEINEAYEGMTLEKLYNFVCTRPNLDFVAYIHTKGIRFLTSEVDRRIVKSVNSWRHLLEWSVIDKWRDAIPLLSFVDVVGANYRRLPWPHFGGNFWWAKASYLRTLPRPRVGEFPEGDYNWITEQGAERKKVTERLDFERWVGLNNPSCHSFFGHPFIVDGRELPPESHNLYEFDIGLYHTWNST